MEKRKIRLKAGEPAQTHFFNGEVSAKPGQSVEVNESQGRQAIETGRFEYVGIETPEIVQTVSNDLPEGFPYKAELASVGIHTLSDLNSADDEKIKGAKGISDARVKEIRKAAIGEQQ